jgi:hypothetical protein
LRVDAIFSTYSDTLNVITKYLSVALSSTLTQTFTTFSATGHFILEEEVILNEITLTVVGAKTVGPTPFFQGP